MNRHSASYRIPGARSADEDQRVAGLVLGDKVVDTRSECELIFSPSLSLSIPTTPPLPAWLRGTLPVPNGCLPAPRRHRLALSLSRLLLACNPQQEPQFLPCEQFVLNAFTSPSVPGSPGRSFADSEGDDPSRVGGPADPLLDAADQLSTVISFKDNNTGVSRSLQMAAQRVAKDSGGGTGRDLQNGFREIATMCEAISLPKSIIDTTKMLFKRVDEEKILRTKNETAIIAACIFIACKQGRVPRTFKEIVALTNVSKKVSTALNLPLSLLARAELRPRPP